MHGQTLLLNGTCLCNSVSPTDVPMYTYNIEILQAIFEQATLLTHYPFTFMYAELQLPPLLLLEVRLSCTSSLHACLYAISVSHNRKRVSQGSIFLGTLRWCIVSFVVACRRKKIRVEINQ